MGRFVHSICQKIFYSLINYDLINVLITEYYFSFYNIP